LVLASRGLGLQFVSALRSDLPYQVRLHLLLTNIIFMQMTNSK